jgi:hypothetical protein
LGNNRAVEAATAQPHKRCPEDIFEDIPLGQRAQPMGGQGVPGRHNAGRPNKRSATTTFKLKVFTADKLNAGLGSTMVGIG